VWYLFVDPFSFNKYLLRVCYVSSPILGSRNTAETKQTKVATLVEFNIIEWTDNKWHKHGMLDEGKTRKRGWGCASSSRVPPWQMPGPEFKSQYHLN
jgi:hypothetical protein